MGDSLTFIHHILELQEVHRTTSPDRILLGKGGLNPEERTALARQLSHAKPLAKKLPSWSSAGFFLPSSLALEQCSSEQAARYKARFVTSSDIVLDLTGGLGVDFWALASVSRAGIYCERQAELVEAARHNLPRLLPDKPLTLLEGQSLELLPELIRTYQPTLLFVDPARREGNDQHKRVYAIEDCEPNLHLLLPELYQLYEQAGLPFPRLLVKLSPMLDPVHTLRTISGIQELHFTSVRGEVKDLLLAIDVAKAKEDPRPEEVTLVASELTAQGEELRVTFPQALALEASLSMACAEEVGAYLFEPQASLMKTGLFHSIAHRLGMRPLHANSHLYTGDQLPQEVLPGRLFRVEAVHPFSSSALKKLGKELPPAQITCRNFPLSPEALRSKLRLSESSEHTLFGTRLFDDQVVLLLCQRIAWPHEAEQ